MRQEEMSKHFGYGTWLLILFAAGAILLSFLPVSHANDAPVITGQVALSTPEEASLTITLMDLMVSDPDNVYPTDFTLSVLEGSNYSISENMITPALNFNGDLTVPVIVNDGLADSAVFNLTVTVVRVNDEPTDIVLSNSLVDEKQPEGTAVGIFSAVDPDVGQTYVYSLVAGTGDDDNNSFAIVNDRLLTAESFDSGDQGCLLGTSENR